MKRYDRVVSDCDDFASARKSGEEALRQRLALGASNRISMPVERQRRYDGASTALKIPIIPGSFQGSLVIPFVFVVFGVVLVVLFGPIIALVIVLFGNVAMAGGLSTLSYISKIAPLTKAN